MTDTTARAPGAASADGDSEAAVGNGRPEATQAPDPVAALTREVAELKDKLLRTLAEMENLRRRTEREVADARVYGIASFARDVLAVGDNMRRAIDAVSADVRTSADPGVKSLLDGVELTERELLKAMEKQNIRKFDPQGEKFDPNLHQAMVEVADPAAPAGTVVQVVQPGYMIGERMLRPALVGVAKGGPKASSQDAGGAQAAGDAAPANDNTGAS
jgi:molecular chaperone GrpE